jgi:hypothetical protein
MIQSANWYREHIGCKILFTTTFEGKQNGPIVEVTIEEISPIGQFVKLDISDNHEYKWYSINAIDVLDVWARERPIKHCIEFDTRWDKIDCKKVFARLDPILSYGTDGMDQPENIDVSEKESHDLP